MKKLLPILVFAAAGLAQVTKPSVEGIAHLARIETTVACSGAIKPGSVEAIHKMGFVSIINLRVPTEPGAGIDDEAAAAKSASSACRSMAPNPMPRWSIASSL